MKYIDVRSDTGTKPTEKMREAMKMAVVGDDVCKDDETTNRLEALAANILGKEAAIFVPSGTFGNQLSLFTHCERGNEVILDDACHIVEHEAGASSIIAGVQLRTLPTVNGEMNLSQIEHKIRKEVNIHFPKTRLICLENATSNGKVLSLEYMEKVSLLAKKYNLQVHLDGARLFNAATSLQVAPKDIAKHCDSVMFCLSKGLCAPIGSIVAGSKAFIDKAIFKRKIMGGGMRQTGVIAAPAIIALEEMTKRLHEDHENAILLASLLENIKNINVFKEQSDINMVFFTINQEVDDDLMMDFFKKNHILIYPSEEKIYRFVTNHGVTKEDVYKVSKVMEDFLTI